MATIHGQAEAAPPGLLDCCKGYLATWVSLIRTRFEIISTEIEEERERLEQIVMLAVAGMFCLSMGVLLLTLLVVVYFWDTQYRLGVLGGFSVLYLALGAFAMARMRREIRNKPRLFSTTMAELAKDHADLNS